MEKIKIGTIFETTDDKLVTNKDTRTSKKKRKLVITSVDKNEDLTGMKIYTHNNNISLDDIVVKSNPPLPKKSVFGKHIITHEYIDEKNVSRLNIKNGNLKQTNYSVYEDNVLEGIEKISNREKRKLNRNK